MGAFFYRSKEVHGCNETKIVPLHSSTNLVVVGCSLNIVCDMINFSVTRVLLRLAPDAP